MCGHIHGCGFGFGFGCGYNPGLTATFGILQGVTSLFSGINEARQVKREGGTTEEAVTRGIGTSLFGMANAGMGIALNEGTHTYWGSALSGMNALMTDNFTYRSTPFFGLPMMLGAGYMGSCCGFTSPYDAAGFYPGPAFYC